jgi:hypothetical protein
MTTTGTSSAKTAGEIDLALIRDTRQRSPLAHQLDLFYRLAVRMVLAGMSAAEVIQQSAERRRQLETILMIPHAMWVNLDRSSLQIQSLVADAIERLAPDLKTTHVPQKQIDRIFGELASLLSDIDRYYARLDELNWSERYQPIGRTFQPHDPLISYSGGTWKFLYDRTGRWLRPQEESQKVGYGGADWKRNAAFIRDVESTIEQWTGPKTRTVAPVDLTVLSTELRILPTSPPWSATRPALERLDQYRLARKPYQGVEDDIKSVGEYAKMLAANQAALTHALLCGAVVGQFVKSEFDAAVSEGLRAISHVCGFSDPARPAAMVEDRLDDLADAIQKRWPALAAGFAQLKIYLDERKHDEWSAALNEMASTIGKTVTFDGDARTAAVQGAWDRWRQFLVKRDTEAFVAGLDDVLCRTANVGPGTLLRDRPAEMSLVDWSRAYFRAVVHPDEKDDQFAPAWLGAIAALALAPLPASRLVSEVTRCFPGALKADELQSLKEAATTAAPQPGSRLSALIVYGDTSSAVLSWPVPVDYATVALTTAEAAQVLALTKTAGRDGLLWTAIDHAFIEGNVQAQEVKPLIDLLAGLPRRSSRLPVIAFNVDHRSPTPAWADRVAARPDDAVALLRTAEARAIADVDELPHSLTRFWESGAHLAGSLEEQPSGAHSEVDVEFTPLHGEVQLAWLTGNRRRLARLRFADGFLLCTGRFVTRRYALLFDGVTVRAEQRQSYVLRFDDFVGKFLASLFVAQESLEFKEEARGWTVELTSRRARGQSPERRAQARLVTVSAGVGHERTSAASTMPT